MKKPGLAERKAALYMNPARTAEGDTEERSRSIENAKNRS